MSDDAGRAIRDLLAVIHRDGGHHTEAVGIGRSARDAIAEVCAMKQVIAERDAQAAEIERLRADLDSYMEATNGYLAEVEQLRAAVTALVVIVADERNRHIGGERYAGYHERLNKALELAQKAMKETK